MTNTERKVITQKLVDALQKTHEAILNVADVAAEIGPEAPELALFVMRSLAESQEPLATLHAAAKTALEMEAEPVPATIQ